MKVLVTGGAGFIGSHLVAELVKDGDVVTIVDNMTTGRLDNVQAYLGDASNQVSLVAQDVREWVVNKDLSEYDHIYHLAAMVGVKRVLEKPLDTVRVNLEGTEALLDRIDKTCRMKDRMPKLFLASTSEIYGKNEAWKLNEDADRVMGSPVKSRWAYAATKAMDEFMVALNAEFLGFPYVIGRLFNVVGPGQLGEYGMVLPRFVRQALDGCKIMVYGDGTQIRSFLHVRDCVKSIMALMRSCHTGIYNIGNEEPIMIKDLAWRVVRLADSKAEIVYVPVDKVRNEYGKGFEDMMRRVPDTFKLKLALRGEIESFANLDEIITDMIEHVRNGGAV